MTSDQTFPEWQSSNGRALIIVGDNLSVLRTLPDGWLNMCVTSPPYFGLRDYGTATWEGGEAGCDHIEQTVRTRRNLAAAATACDGNPRSQENRKDNGAITIPFKELCGKCGARRVDSQIGLEPTPEMYVAKLVAVFREVRRVLRDDGTLWLVLGDSYASGKGRCYNPGGGAESLGKDLKAAGAHPLNRGNKSTLTAMGLKPKDLLGIPWRVALALQADGWWLRQDIIWHKPNPMPESVTDRCTKAHEYLFLLAKSATYYYDRKAVKEPLAESTLADGRNSTGRHTQGKNYSKYYDEESPDTAGVDKPSWYRAKTFVNPESGRNRRSVLTVTTRGYREAHFATFPPDLIRPCIRAGCPQTVCSECGAPHERVVEKTRTFESGSGESGNPIVGKNGPELQGGGEAGDARRDPCVHPTTLGFRPTCSCNKGTTSGIVLDPFSGAATTGVVCVEEARDFVGIELSSEYVEMSAKRIEKKLAS